MASPPPPLNSPPPKPAAPHKADPKRPTRRACVACHASKVKCAYTFENQAKCDRCLKTNRQCVPHISRQGKRPPKKNNWKDSVESPPVCASWSKVALPDVTGKGGTSQLMPMDMFGSRPPLTGNNNSPQFQVATDAKAGQQAFSAESQGQKIVNYQAGHHQVSPGNLLHRHALPTSNSNPVAPTLMQNPRDVNALGNSSAAGYDGSSISVGMLSAVKQQGNVMSVSCMDIEDNSSAPLMTLPLKQWITVAGDSEKQSISHRMNSEYITSCLKIAASLSKQISDAEEMSPEKLCMLPLKCSDWAESITVKIVRENATDDASQDTPSFASAAINGSIHLNGLFDSCFKDDKADAVVATNIHCIDSADIFRSGNFKTSEDSLDPLSTEERRNRLYALGLAFYYLFSGGKVPKSDIKSSARSHEGTPPDIHQSTKENPRMDFTTGLATTQDLDGQMKSFLASFDKKEAAQGINNNSLWSDSEDEDEVLKCVGRSNDEWLDKTFSSDEHDEYALATGLPFKQGISLKDEPFSVTNMLSLDEKIPANDCSSRKKIQESQVRLNPSIESLKQMGLSIALCDLLSNMLDCVNGDLSGDDAYTKMSDVASELQLMIQKPRSFLHDLGTSTLNSAGFCMKEDLFMRDQEYALLLDAYKRSKAGSCELAVITGRSGTGKSYMASRLGRYITADGGFFISVKFDQLKQANPLSALISAFDDYCSMFIAVKDSSQVELMASKLRDALSEDVSYLLKIMPNLSRILKCDSTNNLFHHGCVNGQKKMGYLITRFIEVMSCSSQETVTLYLDDIHWLDDFSLSVFEQIIMMPAANKRIFIVGCYRDDEVDNHHRLKKLIDNCAYYEVKLTKVPLGCADKESVNKIVSELLSLPPRLVTSLSDIVYQKTQGNPLFMSQLLVSLNRDGLLHLSLRRKRWIWDEAQIQSRQLPNDVASFFSRCVTSLPQDTRKVLQVLSCFGASVACDVIRLLETKLKLSWTKDLEVALDEGFICKYDDKFHFAHDSVQNAAYQSIEQNDRSLLHFTYGTLLVKVWSNSELESLRDSSAALLFTAVGQLNLATPLVETNAQVSKDIAEYNLIAAKTAISMSDFSSASQFLTNGIKFLRGDYWRFCYKLSLELHELASKCLLVAGDFPSLSKVSGEVLANAVSFEDRLGTLMVVMASLAYASKISDAITMGFSILSQLGHELPTATTQIDIMSRFKQIQMKLSSISDDAWVQMRPMTDERHLNAMKCLAKLEVILYLVNPNLQPLITLELINITIDHGMSPLSPCGLAYFAGMLGKLGAMADAYRYAKLAKKLLDSGISKEIAGDVIWITSEVLSFFEPLLTVNEYRVQGQAIASAAGDVNFSCLLRVMYCGTMLTSGVNLEKVKDKALQDARYMKGQNHLTSYHHMLHGIRSITILRGKADNEEQSEEQLTNPYQLVTFYYRKIFASYILNTDDLKYFTEKYFQTKTQSWLLLSNHIPHEFFSGLAAYRIYRATGDILWLERGKQSKITIQFWAENGSKWNFEHMGNLLEAEDHYCHARLEDAKVAYSKSITAAKLHKFVNDEAVAHECAGYFYLTANMKEEALDCFISARKKYLEWGATAKANKIFEFLPETCGSISSAASLADYDNPQYKPNNGTQDFDGSSEVKTPT